MLLYSLSVYIHIMNSDVHVAISPLATPHSFEAFVAMTTIIVNCHSL